MDVSERKGLKYICSLYVYSRPYLKKIYIGKMLSCLLWGVQIGKKKTNKQERPQA